MGLHPDGAAAPPPAARDGAHGLSLGAAMRTGAFWLLAAAFTATWLPVFIPLVHLVPFARDLGHSAETGAWLVSALGGGAVLGRLVMGAVSDRIGRRPTLVTAMALQAIAFLGLAAAHGLGALVVTALVYGYSYGTISTLFPAIIGDFFGRAQAGSLVGFLFMLAGSMAAWGPLAAGAVYDATGGYALAFRVSAGVNVLAAVLLTMARAPGARVAAL
jgi:MFS family permease